MYPATIHFSNLYILQTLSCMSNRLTCPHQVLKTSKKKTRYPQQQLKQTLQTMSDSEIIVDTEQFVVPEVPLIKSEGTETTPVETLNGESNGTTAELAAQFQAKAKTYLAEQANHVVIPSFARWFDLDSVHDIERRLFPDFFGDSASKSVYRLEDIYRNIRDFTVNTFRLNPAEYLTVTAVRKNLSGDVSTIIRIHQFLEKWGLINYQIDPRSKSSVVGPQYTGHFQITLDTPTGLVPVVPEEAEVAEEEISQNGEISEKKDFAFNLSLRRNIFTVNDYNTREQNNTFVLYFCNICGKDATSIRYHNLRIKQYTHNPSSTINNSSVLCGLCYEQGLFPANFKSTDFVKLQQEADAKEWLEQEVLLLLEGIEMFATNDASNANGAIHANANNQWDKISEHVGSKSKEQCLVKFVQLPIEDKYLSKLYKPKPTAPTEVNEQLINEIVKKLVSEQDGQTLIQENAKLNVADLNSQLSQLVQQIVELTVSKVNHKLKKVEHLQENLLRFEQQLNLERRQVVVERWAQFEKIEKLKLARPDLALILDDLATPVKISDVAAAWTTNDSDSKLESREDKSELASDPTVDSLPVSVAKPKSYLYWSG